MRNTRTSRDSAGRSLALSAACEPLERRVLLSLSPAGPEFRVNTYTTDGQSDSAVAMDGDGDFVVVWNSYPGQDGSLSGVYAQRYNAAGVPQGSEFRVNTTTALDQFAPAVAMDAYGDFVVVWHSDGQDGSYLGIYAQRYNAAGAAQGGEFRVNTHTTGRQAQPSIAIDGAGDFVVAWNSDSQDGAGNGVYAQRYNAAGAAQGAEFRVNTYTSSNQDNPTVAIDADGDFVVAWTSGDMFDNGHDGNRGGVSAQRYDAAGAPQGGEFRINTYTTGDQVGPSIAMDSDGDFVIAWSSDGQDGSNYGVYAQRYNAAGVAQSGEFRVNTYTTSTQFRPVIAMDSDGDFVIAWISFGQDGDGSGIYAQRYNAAGAPLGGEFRVNADTTHSQTGPTVAMDANGNFVAAWQDMDLAGAGIYAQRFNAAGVAQGGEFRANTYTTGDQFLPSVAMDSDGDFIITWGSYDQDGSYAGIYAQRYNPAGSPQGGEFRVNTITSESQFAQSVAMDSDGDFVVRGVNMSSHHLMRFARAGSI